MSGIDPVVFYSEMLYFEIVVEGKSQFSPRDIYSIPSIVKRVRNEDLTEPIPKNIRVECDIRFISLVLERFYDLTPGSKIFVRMSRDLVDRYNSLR